jgi:hypothetical protein
MNRHLITRKVMVDKEADTLINGEHPADAGLAGEGMNRRLDEVSGEGRLLVLLGKVAIFNPVLERETFVTSRFCQRNAAVTRTHLAIGKLNIRSG